jgi:hypothetical protein
VSNDRDSTYSYSFDVVNLSTKDVGDEQPKDSVCYTWQDMFLTDRPVTTLLCRSTLAYDPDCGTSGGNFMLHVPEGMTAGLLVDAARKNFAACLNTDVCKVWVMEYWERCWALFDCKSTNE